MVDDDQERVWASERQKCKDSLYYLNKAVIGHVDLTPELHLPFCNFQQLSPQNSPFPQARLKAALMPRNHFKSTNASVGKPIYLIIQDPQETINLISAVEINTIGWLAAIQHVFQNNTMFRWLFPELIPSDDRWDEASKTRFTVPRDDSLMPEPQPTIQATSIVSGQASKHVRRVILDDPVNEMTVDSPRLIDRAVDLYKLLESTLQDYESSSIDLTATPWGFGDVVEYAINHEVADGSMLLWQVGCYGKFTMSSHFDEYQEWQLPNSNRVMNTEMLKYKGKQGEPIFPQRYPKSELKRLEKKYGPFLFSCNYLVDPFDPSQSGFDPKALNYFTLTPEGKVKCDCHKESYSLKDIDIIMLVDPAWSDKDDAAESAIVVAGQAPNGCRFVLHTWSDKVEPDGIWARIVEQCIQWSPFLKDVGIESVASQKLFKFWFEYLQSIKEHLPDKEAQRLPQVMFHDMKPDNDIDKIRRIKAQQLFVANGAWHIQYGMDAFLGQFTKFPRARPVDILDAWAYGDYIWNLPRRDLELGINTGQSDWNRQRDAYHKSRRLYGR